MVFLLLLGAVNIPKGVGCIFLLSSGRKQPQVSGPLYRRGQFSLVLGAKPGFFPWPYLSQTGNKAAENIRFFEVYFLYVFLAKVAIHVFRKVYL